MTRIVESIIVGKLDRNTSELETSFRPLVGEVMQALPLSTGVTLERELLPDGKPADIVRINVNYGRLFSGFRSNQLLLLRDGEIFSDMTSSSESQQPIRGIQKASLLARVALGRVDHWDRETDFVGVIQE